MADVDQLLRAVFEVCEATEDIEPKNDFERGRVFEAKHIRRGVGTWFQDTFCGRTHMGEPLIEPRPTRPLSDVECWEQGKPDSIDRAMAAEAEERAHDVQGIDGPRRGPEADGSQKPNDAAAIPCAKAGSNTYACITSVTEDGDTMTIRSTLPNGVEAGAPEQSKEPK